MATAISAADLITRARDLVGDADSNTFTDAIVTRWLNDAQQEWAETTRCLWRYATDLSEESKQEYGLFASFFPCTVYKVTYNSGSGGDKPLDPLRWFDEVYAYSTTWNTTEGLPLKYYIRQNLLGLLPIPSSSYVGNTIRIEGFLEPSTIADGTDPNIDNAYHYLLAYYAAARIAAIDQRPDLEAKYDRKFYGEMALVKSRYAVSAPETRLRQYNPVAIK